jgi:methionyl-tRNA formyltransferase
MIGIVICTIKSWNIKNAKELKEKYKDKFNIKIISDKKDLSYDFLKKFNPSYVFFPHWSYIISKDIFENFNCIIFHMTDIPFGRGGSPLQNLIARGIYKTKISALKVIKEVDAGPIYIKRDLDISQGSAEEIFKKASDIIFNEMIPYIVENNLLPSEQFGDVISFKRRQVHEGELEGNFDLQKIYDYIRMLDAEGYPHAFINFGNYRLSFTKASTNYGSISASVKFEIMEN